ncbi:hypothetical protein [Musicola keenii]|nr:hypothetical protein [Musicola keenii]
MKHTFPVGLHLNGAFGRHTVALSQRALGMRGKIFVARRRRL